MSASALLADAVLVLHGLFIVWVVAGGLAALRWPGLAWLHLPALAWGVWISVSGTICPLTPLELQLRAQAGQAGWQGGFIEHHLTAAIYPEGLSRTTQGLLAALLLLGNLLVYRAWLKRRRARRAGIG